MTTHKLMYGRQKHFRCLPFWQRRSHSPATQFFFVACPIKMPDKNRDIRLKLIELIWLVAYQREAVSNLKNTFLFLPSRARSRSLSYCEPWLFSICRGFYFTALPVPSTKTPITIQMQILWFNKCKLSHRHLMLDPFPLRRSPCFSLLLE